ncbi:glycosyltransferase family 2 protein [Methanobrevibacter sp.]|uniref:glycosyltransferase family 2 protein n=1 Tax=Methanobrevibacter sp. TaxID=66852 RepID=UPI0038904F36
MYDISIIVPINKYEERIRKLLKPIDKQKSYNIELIFTYSKLTAIHEKILKEISSRHKNVKLIHDNSSLTYFKLQKEISGKYFIFLSPQTDFEIDDLKSAFDFAESNKLDILLFKKENSKNRKEYKYFEKEFGDGKIFNKKDTVDNLFKIPVNHLFKLYKTETAYSNNVSLNKNIHSDESLFFYETYLNSQNASFRNISFRDESKPAKRKMNFINYANDLLDIFLKDEKFPTYENSAVNEAMDYLIKRFKRYSMHSRQKHYESIRDDFKGMHEYKELFKKHLTKENLLIYNLICENRYYLDFLSNYKLHTTDYVVLNEGKQKRESGYKISVIIPVYNTGKIIHRTLLSIENQTFGIENIEVILIDDSSDDDTSTILNGYCELDNYKIIRIKNRTGSPGTPRNIGLREATSDYVMFLDHDDFFETDALEILYDAISNNACDVVYGTYASIDFEIPTKITYPDEKQGMFANIDENERIIAFPPPSIWTKIFKRKFLIENEVLFTGFLGEDAIFMSKALSNANGIAYLGDSLICYHDLNNNSTTNRINYKYLSEGLISEDYLYNFYLDIGKENFCKIRGESMLDFYLIQFYKAKLTEKEVRNIFPEMYKFTNRFKELGLRPTHPINQTLFEHIMKKDLDSILIMKNIKVKNENRLKAYLGNLASRLK